MIRQTFLQTALTLLFCLLLGATAANAQTTAFTYQGRLTDSSATANGNYDFEFALFDQAANGTQQGATQSISGATVINGIFTVQLNFGAAPFAAGTNRFFEIRVKQPTQTEFTTLQPRQRITSTPYSTRALLSDTANSAANADNSANLGGTPANQFVQTGDARLSDERAPTAGSGNYIQNTTTAQTANFNITGNGTSGGTFSGNAINSATDYKIRGQTVLRVGTDSSGSIFAGLQNGTANTTGERNSFFGGLAGESNTTGSDNSFIGSAAGNQNTSGLRNSFFGSAAGLSNTTGDSNSFFGNSAGLTGTTGGNNSIFGAIAGLQLTTGESNSFFGFASGAGNKTGSDNVFMGIGTGVGNTTGSDNSFVGRGAGFGNTTGNSNTMVGASANVNSGDLTFATAIGANAAVSTSNTIVLGRANGADKVRVPGLGAAGTTALCRNQNNEISICAAQFNQADNADLRAAVTQQNLRIEQQRRRIDELKNLVCALKPEAAVCREEK